MQMGGHIINALGIISSFARLLFGHPFAHMAFLHALLSLPTTPVYPFVVIRPNHKRRDVNDRPRVYDMTTPSHTWFPYEPFCRSQQCRCIHWSSYMQPSVVRNRRYVPTAVGNFLPKRFLQPMFRATRNVLHSGNILRRPSSPHQWVAMTNMIGPPLCTHRSLHVSPLQRL